MIYELVLISVVIGAGYWGWFFLRNPPAGALSFGAMQLAAAVLSGLGLIGRKVDATWLGVAGAIGAGTGTCLLVVGPLVRTLARRLVAADHTRVALRLLDLAELLVPGSGVAEEKALVRAMTEIREGRIEQTVDALEAARHRAPADARRAIDERIAMLYLSAYRWTDAIHHAEAHLLGDAPAASAPRDDANLLGDAGGPVLAEVGDGSLRHALGLAPPVWVELLGAYGRTGDLARAAAMLARLEDACAGREDAALWLHRARVMFLALAGRLDAVRALVAPRRAHHMTTAARTYWLAVAHEHHGDRDPALALYAKARSRSRGRPRELIDLALARIATAGTPAAVLAPATLEVIARVEAAPAPVVIRVARRPGPRATWLLTALALAVSGVVAFAIGDLADAGVLVRAGAMGHSLVAGGEWWRLIACVFLHVGSMHLLLNATGLFVLGRLTEDLFGGAKMIALFGAAGIAGSIASYAASPDGISAGASGAVFGLLGAVFVELTWHRPRYRQAWKRGMWGALAVVTVGQLGYGFLYPMIDQWAHIGGLVAGAVLGVVLSPNARWARAGGYLGRVVAVGFGAIVIAAAVLVVQTPLATTLAAGGGTRHVAGGVAITAPAAWPTGQARLPAGSVTDVIGTLVHPDGLLDLKLAALPGNGNPAAQLARWIANDGRPAASELGDLSVADAPLIALPAGWTGQELIAAPEDELGYRQRIRVIVCGRAFGDTLVVLSIMVPETVASAVPGFVAALIASSGPA